MYWHSELTEVHDVVSADGTVVYDDVYSGIRVSLSDAAAANETRDHSPHAHNATAFHCKQESQ